MSSRLSIVIPLGPRDAYPPPFLSELERCLPDAEIVISAGEHEAREIAHGVWVASPWGRAKQLNAGAAAAQGPWIWFLHADSRVDEKTARRASEISDREENAVHYFRLRFDESASALARINQVGANWRSRFFSMPFGDQGFLVPKKTWRALGGYSERVPYAEDNLFIWSARRAGVRVVGERERLITSARKYREHGWLKTTLAHLAITWGEAARQYAQRAKRVYRRGTGIGIFVKTPGLSPIKTRLAKETSPSFADLFYRGAVAAMEALGQELQLRSRTTSYWAVAEASGMKNPFWKNLPRLFQGEGDLGARLGRIYSQLSQRHRTAILVGCDSPQLAVSDIRAAQAALAKNDFVLGPTPDGGFYLFASKRYLPPAFWESIPYSSTETTKQMIERLETLGKVGLLPEKTDVDVASDLDLLASEIQSAPADAYSLPQQRALEALSDRIESEVP